MKKDDFNAKYLERLLIAIVLIIAIGGTIGFYFAQDKLKNIAIETNTTLAKASKLMSDSNNPTTVGDPEIQSLAIKTVKMTYQPSNFQAEATKDIKRFGIESGITINSVELAPETAPPVLFNNIKAKKLLVSIGSPAPFAGLMKFIRATEANIPKMQVINLSLSNIRANNNSVTIEPITIEVYTN